MAVVIASVPAGHVYVRHLAAPGTSDDVVRLPDPGVEPGAPAARWWPPAMLDPDWVQAHAHEFDVMHIHFGFDAQPPSALRRLVDMLRLEGKPLVVTVHDLRNPHHSSAELHDEQLEVLIRGADAVVTLTPGAASEIRDRWGRAATVLPHPHVVDAPQLARRREDHDGFVIGVHLKSLRANMDPLPVIETITEALGTMPTASLRVDVHTDVMTPGSERYSAAVSGRLREVHARGGIDLRVHDYFTDAELWDYLSSLDVSVLPYRFGTHSGWLEACYDLGTTVLAPDCGYYAEQRPCLTYSAAGHARPDPAVPTLETALRWAHEHRPSWRADPVARSVERLALAHAHETLYTRVLERRVACTSS